MTTTTTAPSPIPLAPATSIDMAALSPADTAVVMPCHRPIRDNDSSTFQSFNCLGRGPEDLNHDDPTTPLFERLDVLDELENTPAIEKERREVRNRLIVMVAWVRPFATLSWAVPGAMLTAHAL